MEAIYYTMSNINGDYAEMVSDDGQKHSLTMFLLPEGTTVGEPAEAGELSMEPVWMNRAVRGWTTLTAGKSPRFARRSPCSARARGCDSIQAGCRPLELSGLILKHLPLKKGIRNIQGRGCCASAALYI